MKSSKHCFPANNSQNLFFDVEVRANKCVLRAWAPSAGDIAKAIVLDVAGRYEAYPTLGTLALGSTLGTRQPNTLYSFVWEQTLDRDAMLGAREWESHTTWMYLTNRIRGFAPFNASIETAASKSRSPRYLESIGRTCVLQVWTPLASSDILGSTVSLSYDPEHGYACNIPLAEVPTEAVTQQAYNAKFLPKLSVTGPASIKAGEVADYTVTIRDSDGITVAEAAEIYLEATAGYLPKQRLITDTGSETFKLRALDLAPGDSIKLKVGFRHVSGLAETTVAVC